MKYFNNTFILSIVLLTIILAGFLSCKNDSVNPPKAVQHFPVIYRFVDTSDTTVLSFEVHAGVYFPKEEKSTYQYSGEANAVVGYVLEDSITASHGAVTEPYTGVKAGMVVMARKFWHGNTGKNIPTWRAWHLKERVINDPDSNMISFKWPQDTLSPYVEYIGYVQQ